VTTIAALSGGVGGAKLVLGFCRHLGDREVTILTNTGDDFEHLGLYVSPDLDTVMYTLSGLSNQDTGWGRDKETWNFMRSLEVLGGESWFSLGDKDLATIVERTRRLKLGQTLTEVTRDFATRLGVNAQILPMSDDPVRTQVLTQHGELSFQHYFVRDACKPVVTGFRFDGFDVASANPAWFHALSDKNLRAVVICPSNPFISIDPILSLPGVRTALCNVNVPVVAVSPIVGTEAIKGPTAKMMRELGYVLSANSVAQHYEGLLDGFVLDNSDDVNLDMFQIPVLRTPIIMNTLDDRMRLARDILEFAETLAI
tara:strand:+ start:160 stop:1098 length:939 start_codon:yes stop_codon:yes gene_type:complete